MRQRWLAAAVAVAIAAAAAAHLLHAAPALAQPAATQPPPSAETPEQVIERDLAQQAQLLTAADSKPDQREQAAERLVLRQRPEAREILLGVLNDPTPANLPARLAVARALAQDTRPDPRFVEPLLRLLD